LAKTLDVRTSARSPVWTAPSLWVMIRHAFSATSTASDCLKRNGFWEESMSSPKQRKRTKTLFVSSLMSAAFLAAASTGPAASLYYYKGPTRAPNERVCLSFAMDQARRHNLQNIKQDRLGVAGVRDKFYVAITCVGNVVVVMASGDGAANGDPLSKELFDAVRSETCIDSADSRRTRTGTRLPSAVSARSGWPESVRFSRFGQDLVAGEGEATFGRARTGRPSPRPAPLATHSALRRGAG
jgi:hypothetical protein